MKRSRIVSGIVLAIGTALIIISLIIVYSTMPNRNNVDLQISLYFHNNYNPSISYIFFLITKLGEQMTYIILILTLYYIWDKKKAYRIMITIISSALINGVIKYSFNLPRPNKNMWYEKVSESSPGLPSGHTQISTSFWGTLSCEVKKHYFTVLVAIITLLVALSRLILNVHWFTDVLMGFGIGFIIIAIYMETEQKLSLIIDRLKFGYKLLVAAIFFVILVVIGIFALPTKEIMYGNTSYPKVEFLKALTLFFTASLAYIFEGRLINFNSKPNKWWKYITRIIIGLGIFLVSYVLLSYIAEYFMSLTDLQYVKDIIDIIKYALLGPIAVLISPWVIQLSKM